jgi:hypothetical protein
MTLKVWAHAHEKGGGACVATRFAPEQQAKRDAPSEGSLRSNFSG